jgi:hypothetical protein
LNAPQPSVNPAIKTKARWRRNSELKGLWMPRKPLGGMNKELKLASTLSLTTFKRPSRLRLGLNLVCE